MTKTDSAKGEISDVFRTGSYPDIVHYGECKDCLTQFRWEDRTFHCNGHHISRCPWCRPDSKAWRGGRGA